MRLHFGTVWDPQDPIPPAPAHLFLLVLLVVA